MKRMYKTRAMLSFLIEDKMSRKEGYPLLDIDRKEVAKEIARYEKWYTMYKATTVLLFILLAVIGLRSCL